MLYNYSNSMECVKNKTRFFKILWYWNFANFPKNKPKKFIYNVHFSTIVPQFFPKKDKVCHTKKKLDQNQTNTCANELRTFTLVFGLMFMINIASCDHIIVDAPLIWCLQIHFSEEFQFQLEWW
jgi:hypothetical protein